MEFLETYFDGVGAVFTTFNLALKAFGAAQMTEGFMLFLMAMFAFSCVTASVTGISKLAVAKAIKLPQKDRG